MVRNAAVSAVLVAWLATLAQDADRAGFARFPVVVGDHELYEALEHGRPATTTVYRGGNRIGRGEVVALMRGRTCWYGEFRGFVGKGRVGLGPLRLTEATPRQEPAIGLDGQTFDWQPPDGRLHPRWRGVAASQGMTVSCDFYEISSQDHPMNTIPAGSIIGEPLLQCSIKANIANDGR